MTQIMNKLRALILKFKSFRRIQKVVLLAFLLALAFTSVRIVHTATDMVYWHKHQDEPLNNWMTLHYVAHSYHIPPHVLYETLEMPDWPPDRRSLKELSQALDIPLETLKSKLQQAIVYARPPYPRPGPPQRHNRERSR